MWDLSEMLGKYAHAAISGSAPCRGTLIDIGTDIIVLYNEERHFYIPSVHIQHLEVYDSAEHTLEAAPVSPYQQETGQLSFRKVLDNARGRFVELYVSGNKTIHGYVTSLMNDYFLFYSPAYKTMYVALQHVKWIVPYQLHSTPYSLSAQHFPLNPSTAPLSRTFDQQCKKLEGQLVVFDGGDHSKKIGQLQKVENNKIELITAWGEKVYWNLQHLKTVHVP